MTTWEQFTAEAPELASAAVERFTAMKHHVLATIRKDGSPRVSGTEVDFHGPDLIIGSMWNAVKARDLRRDPRFALHANPGEGSMTGGDVKVSGRAIEVTDPDELRAYADEAEPPEPFHLFRLDLEEVVLTGLAPEGDHMLLSTWRPGQSLLRYARYTAEPARLLSDS
ncbi:MAG: pyridoxamine 5'-phosphate oxidase family protein [Pseudonocardiaceae bacterium]|nr:pyridoxamine 5'-phosphate oxidase family protein [Pseudonocardiaceae bacterium]